MVIHKSTPMNPMNPMVQPSVPVPKGIAAQNGKMTYHEGKSPTVPKTAPEVPMGPYGY
jgi:hypothetical protein